MNLMSQTEYAEHRGVSQQRISKMVARGTIPITCLHMDGKRKKIDRDAADAALKENLDRVHNPKHSFRHKSKKKPSPPEMEQTAKKAGTQDMSLADAQKLQAQYKAALLKLDYEQKSDQLVEVFKVKAEAFEMARMVRDGILNIPDRISAELASCTDVHEINQKLTVTLTEVLEELSGR